MTTPVFTHKQVEEADQLKVDPRRARLVIEHLTGELGLDRALATWCGSFRRQQPVIGDLDLVAPMPAADSDEDELAEKLQTMFPAEVEAGAEFRGPGRGLAVRGVKPGFRACRCLLKLHREPAGWLGLDIHRYQWTGLMSNRGWIELIRTGPAEFARDVMVRWRSLTGCPKGQSASQEGWPVAGAKRFNCPTEADAFRLLQLPYIAPADRGRRRFDLQPGPCRDYTEPTMV